MRDFIDSHMSLVLYLVRIPTRFLMIFLGAKNAPLHDVLYLMLFSLILVAWIKMHQPVYSGQDIPKTPEKIGSVSYTHLTLPTKRIV